MNIKHLQVFVQTCLTGSISKAADSLNISPALASLYLIKLEESIHLKLIHRTTRYNKVTPEGQEFLKYALKILSSVDEANNFIQYSNNEIYGKIRFTMPVTFGNFYIVNLLPKFLDEHKNVSIDVDLSDNIVNILENNFDLAIRIGSINDSSMVAKEIAPDTRILCASKEYLKQHGTPRSLEELNNHQLLSFKYFTKWKFLKNNEIVNFYPKNARLTFNNSDALLYSLVNHIGITVGSTWLFNNDIKNDNLVKILPDYKVISDSKIWLMYPQIKSMSPAIRALINFLEKHLKNSIPV